MTQSFLERVIATFSKGASGLQYSDEWWSRNVDTAAKFMSLLEARTPAKVLDLACGSGGVATALALDGFSVTGIDCTPAMLELGRKASKRKNVSVEWLLQDVREIEYKNVFDYVLLWDVWFGIFENEEQDRELISRVASALKAGGRCLFEVYNKEFALTHGVENALFFDEALDRFVEKESGPSSIKLYTHAEWETVLSDSNLKLVKTDGCKWPRDPAPPPWRFDYIVAEKV